MTISTDYCVASDFCRQGDTYSLVDVVDSAMVADDPAAYGEIFIYPTSLRNYIFIRELSYKDELFSEGFVEPVDYPRRFAGIRIRPKKCFYRKIDSWTILQNGVSPSAL